MKNPIYLSLVVICFLLLTNFAFTQDQQYIYFSDTNSYLSNCDAIMKDAEKKAKECWTGKGTLEELQEGAKKCLALNPSGNIDQVAAYKYKKMLEKFNRTGTCDALEMTGWGIVGLLAGAGDVAGGSGVCTTSYFTAVTARNLDLETKRQEFEAACKEWNLYQAEKGYNKTFWSQF